jgi:hypothetical protein
MMESPSSSTRQGEGRIASRDELARAISEAGQRRTSVGLWRPSGFITDVNQLQSLPPFGLYRSVPPKQPPKPVSRDVSPSEPQGLVVVSRPVDASVDARNSVDKSLSRNATLSRRRRRRRLSVTLRIRLKW